MYGHMTNIYIFLNIQKFHLIFILKILFNHLLISYDR